MGASVVVEPEVQEAGLQTIAAVLQKLVEEAQKIDQPLLAHMLDMAKAEAENQIADLKE
jgi:hypothetical protein